MPDPNTQTPAGVLQGASFDKMSGFTNFIGVQREATARDPSVPQVIVRYAQFTGWEATGTGRPRVAKVSIGGGHYLWGHSLEPALNPNDRVVMLTWGTAQALILGKLVIT